MRVDPVSFPALSESPQRGCDSSAARLRFLRRLQAAEVSFRRTGRGATRVARAAVGLAAAERVRGRCDAAEAILSNVLSTLAWIALERPSTGPLMKANACEAATWCAEELAELYEEHDRPRHAAAVRLACAEIGRRANASSVGAPLPN